MKTTIKNSIIHIRFDNQYEMTSTMVRIQEFYESPYQEIRGKFFTLDKFMDVYTKNNEKSVFTYFTDWEGFNLPDKTIRKFLWLYLFRLRKKEVNLLNQIPLAMLLGFKKFYLIATINDDCLEHETAHALYYLNNDYFFEMINLIGKLTKKQLVTWFNKLEKKGYCKEVFWDEIQAYSIDEGVKKFKEVYNKYSNK
jgi:hypothetical protein